MEAYCRLNKDEELRVLKPEIPKEVGEIIRQYGDIIEAYKRIVEAWSHPPSFILKGGK